MGKSRSFQVSFPFLVLLLLLSEQASDSFFGDLLCFPLFLFSPFPVFFFWSI